MKILFIVTQSEFGGAQKYVYELATHLNPQEYEVKVAFGQGDDGLMSKLKCKMSNVKCQKLKYLKRTPVVSALPAIAEIYNLIKKEKPDVLFLCSTTAGILGSIAAWVYNPKAYGLPIKVIYRIGGWAFRDPRPKWQKNLIIYLEKLTSGFKHKIIVNSEIDYKLALKHKISPQNKLIKIYNGIDVGELNFLSKEEARKCLMPTLIHKTNDEDANDGGVTPVKLIHKTNDEDANDGGVTPVKIIGTIANFYKTKGLEYLIQAAHILCFTFHVSGFKLLIIGDGKQKKALEDLIEKHNLKDQVLLVGRKPDAYKYLKAFDIFVLPSVKEGFPWIILEAMAAEIPIISTKVGAVPEIIEHNKQGLLVEPKNNDALTKAITSMLNNPNKAQQMAQLAKQRLLEEFTLQKMLSQTKYLL